MSTRRIAFAESAIVDLEGMRAYHASQLVPEVGERLVGEVFSAVEQLAEFPDSGRVVPEFDTPVLRELIHPPFRIVYRVEGVRIHAVRICRSERLMDEPPGNA